MAASNGPTGSLQKDTHVGRVYRDRYFKDQYFEALALIRPVVEAQGLTMIETAIRWLVHHSALRMTAESGGNDGIIVGASSLGQLSGNLDDFEKGRLPTEVLDVLDKAWEIVKSKAPTYWLLDLTYGYDSCKVLFGG
jgi:aflatoxin B1 aldehyde reductase